MFFSSDNWAGAHPRVNAALQEYGGGVAAPYGGSELDAVVAQRFSEVFERDVMVFSVATGTAANALALSALSRPGGKVLCHPEAHIVDSECGAVEFFSPGTRIQAVGGDRACIDPDELESCLSDHDPRRIPSGRPDSVSISQLNERGVAYTLPEIARIADLAHTHGLAVHMDGARFANALVELECSPAEMTWRQGVDVLSFGGTKNGCWSAEAVVFFNPLPAADFEYLRKRGGQLFSKTRFVAAQFAAYFEDELWLQLATQANAAATLLRDAIDTSQLARQAWVTHANEVFALVGSGTEAALREAGAHYLVRGTGAGIGENPFGTDARLLRLVTSWSTTKDDVHRFAEILH